MGADTHMHLHKISGFLSLLCLLLLIFYSFVPSVFLGGPPPSSQINHTCRLHIFLVMMWILAGLVSCHFFLIQIIPSIIILAALSFLLLYKFPFSLISCLAVLLHDLIAGPCRPPPSFLVLRSFSTRFLFILMLSANQHHLFSSLPCC